MKYELRRASIPPTELQIVAVAMQFLQQMLSIKKSI